MNRVLLAIGFAAFVGEVSGLPLYGTIMLAVYGIWVLTPRRRNYGPEGH